MFWAVTIIVTLKYVVLIMRADNDGETHYLRVHVAHIRAKLGEDLIVTEPGVGYRLTTS